MKKRLKTVLVVEDIPEILEKITKYISFSFRREVQVLKASTISKAVEIIKQGLVDISLIDLMLPDGDGEDLVALIREYDKHLPIIIHTTKEEMSYQLEVYKKYRNIDYLTKDVLFEELTTCLKEAIEDVTYLESYRLSLPGGSTFDSLDINEVCYVTTLDSTNHLNVWLYKHEDKKFKKFTIKNMTLTKFLETYNGSGFFLRTHNSYVVNKKMVRKINRTHNEVVMLYDEETGYPLRILMSENYKSNILSTLKGLY